MNDRNWRILSTVIARILSFLRNLITGLLPLIYSFLDLVFFGVVPNRTRIAQRLRQLEKQLIEQPNDKTSLKKIEQAAKSSNRFERCYALDTLGRLGTLAENTIETQVIGLLSQDPFVREAASQALFRMKKLAAPAKKKLIDILYLHANEGTARYAVLALCEIGDASPDVLDVLKHAATVKESYAANEAANTYYKLTGIPLKRE